MKYQLFKISQYLRGWINYYGIASGYQKCVELDHWIRRRVRMAYWRQWRKPRTKVRSLIRLGVPIHTAVGCGETLATHNRIWLKTRYFYKKQTNKLFNQFTHKLFFILHSHFFGWHYFFTTSLLINYFLPCIVILLGGTVFFLIGIKGATSNPISIFKLAFGTNTCHP